MHIHEFGDDVTSYLHNWVNNRLRRGQHVTRQPTSMRRWLVGLAVGEGLVVAGGDGTGEPGTELIIGPMRTELIV